MSNTIYNKMPGYSYATATPDGSCCPLPLLVFLTNKETLTGSTEYIGIPHGQSNIYRSSPVFVLLHYVGVLPLLVFLTNKETFTCSFEFIGIPHHRSNAYRSPPVFVLLPILVSCRCWCSSPTTQRLSFSQPC